MFERFLHRLVYTLFGVMVWMALTNPAQAWEYALDDFSTTDWSTSSGWGTCNAYSSSRPCISNGSYFSVDSGDVVFSYTYANIYDVVDVSDISYSYDSGKTYYISFDAMVGPRNSEQGNKTEYLSVTIYYKKSDSSTIGYESFYQNINNTSMETFEFALNDTMLSHPSLDKLQILISGRDNGYWNGNYGMVLANGSVQLTDYDPTAPAAPTYSSDPTAAQLQSRTDARNITTNGNAIYVTQSGDRADIDITQYDNDNLVAGTSSTANNITDATITGDDNTVSITQGNNAGSFSDDNVTLLDVNGTNNSITVRQGDNVDDVGGHRSSTNVVGNYNTLGILQENDGGVGSNGHYMEIDVAGNSNVMYMDQKDDGDKMLFLDVNGSSNDVDILQQGTGEHFLDITAGSNQTIDVNQDGSGSHAATIDMSGYSSTLDLDQTGSTDQTYSLTQICTNANGCGTTTINQN
jgi:hypothetical protein